MPYSRWVSPKSRCTSWPAACAATSVAESAASGALLMSVFQALSGGRTGQPARIGPSVTTNTALAHEPPRQARRRWRPSGTPVRRSRVVWRRAVAALRPSIESVRGRRPVTLTVSVAPGRTPTGETRREASATCAVVRAVRAARRQTRLPARDAPRQPPGRAALRPRVGAPSRRAHTRPLAQRVDPREEPLQQPDRLLGGFDLRHVAAVLEDDLLGAGKPLGHVRHERRRDDPGAGAPDEHRGGLELAQPRGEDAASERAVEVDVAGRG